jgi:hypothetical protein
LKTKPSERSKKHAGFQVNILLRFCDFNQNWDVWTTFSKNPEYDISIKQNRPVGTPVFHAGRQTDRDDGVSSCFYHFFFKNLKSKKLQNIR